MDWAIQWCNRDPRCKKLQLTDLLVAPVQHIMKVPLLLREIESRTEDSQEKEIVLKILDKEETSLSKSLMEQVNRKLFHSLQLPSIVQFQLDINRCIESSRVRNALNGVLFNFEGELDDKMKWLKNFERLLEIQRSLVWPSVLDMEPKTVVPEFLKIPLAKQPCERLIVSPRRQIVLEGPLTLLDTGRPSDMHVILFDDMLLITRKKKGLGKKVSTCQHHFISSFHHFIISSFHFIISSSHHPLSDLLLFLLLYFSFSHHQHRFIFHPYLVNYFGLSSFLNFTNYVMANNPASAKLWICQATIH